MANERALLKYRNPDSTQDINDRLAGLLVKGVFQGGLITPAAGLRITLDAFSTIGSDGMFVKSNAQDIDVTADPFDSVKTYIVIQQQYQANADPIVSVEALPSGLFDVTGPEGEQGADNPNMIVFGTVTLAAGSVLVSNADIEFFERDTIDVLGRSNFRGLVSSLGELPGVEDNANRVGDFYTLAVDDVDTVPSFWSWNGSSWVNSTDTTALETQLTTHRGNNFDNENHVSDDQAAALGGVGVEDPSESNQFVLKDYAILPTQDEKDALTGNGLPLEDEVPSATNPYITSTKVIASPDEISGVPSFNYTVPSQQPADWVELGPAQNSDGYYVGTDVTGTAQQWFALFSPEEPAPNEYINEDFAAVVVTEIRVGNAGGLPSATELNPSGDGHVDDLGFFITDSDAGGTLYLRLSAPISVNTARVSFGRRTHWGDTPPQLMLSRGPQAAQINSIMLRLFTGTPNVQFSDVSIWDDVNPGLVAAWDNILAKFVKADPNASKTPIGVRGDANNLIQEGMLVLPGANFPIGSQVYADKANPGSLTTLPNEWFIGTAITDTILLVNMNGIPLQASGEVTPGVTFPSALFSSVGVGQTVAFDITQGLFVRAEINFEPSPGFFPRLPTGIRGTRNNVIISGSYTAPNPLSFDVGVKYYADTVAGILTPSPNDWYIGVATSDQDLFVNVTSVAVPHKWTEEHDSNTGFHKFKFGNTGERPANPVAGTIFLRTDLAPPRIEYWDGGSWEDASSDFTFPSGTRMLFVQDTVPSGWSLDASIHDAVIRVVDNSTTLGNQTSGTWVISGVSDNPLSLSEDQIPVHYHLLLGASGDNNSRTLNDRGPLGSNVGGGSGGTDPFSSFDSGVRENYGSNHSTPSPNDPHQHGVTSDGVWRPFNLTAIVCVKD